MKSSPQLAGLIRQQVVPLCLQHQKHYEPQDLCTILYSLKKIDESFENSIRHLFEAYFQDPEKFKQVSHLDYLVLFLALRNILQRNSSQHLSGPYAQLLNQFLEAKLEIPDSTKIRILYEIGHNSKILSKALFLDHFLLWTIELDLRELNTHDLVALGNLMKKFVRITHEHFFFWHKFLHAVKDRNVLNFIEFKKIDQILLNMKEFLIKCTHNKNHQQSKTGEIQILIEKFDQVLKHHQQ